MSFKSFGGAACQSSSFGWPLIVSDDFTASAGFYFANTTLKTHLNDRLPQKILIDVGGLEEDPIYQVKPGLINLNSAVLKLGVANLKLRKFNGWNTIRRIDLIYFIYYK